MKLNTYRTLSRLLQISTFAFPNHFNNLWMNVGFVTFSFNFWFLHAMESQTNDKAFDWRIDSGLSPFPRLFL